MDINNTNNEVKYNQFEASYLSMMGFDVSVERLSGNYIKFSVRDDALALAELNDFRNDERLMKYVEALKTTRARMRSLPRFAPKPKVAEPAAAEAPENDSLE